MKNLKLNNLIRRFMTSTYIVAILTAITAGLMSWSWWSFLLVPLYSAVLLLLAYLLNIYVEHRFITYPYERNAQVTLGANKILNGEIEHKNKRIEQLEEDLIHYKKEYSIVYQTNRNLMHQKDENKARDTKREKLLKTYVDELNHLNNENLNYKRVKKQKQILEKGLENIIGWHDDVEENEDWEYPETIAEKALEEMKKVKIN